MAQQREIEEELLHLNTLIKKYKGNSSQGGLKLMPLMKKQSRVRGVLAAAREAVEQTSEPFDKNQLLEMIMRDQKFTHKQITGSNIRNALRLLTQHGVIRIASEATATSCARYVKAA